MELNGRGDATNPWSLRHTAIYHNLDPYGRQHVIVLNPCEGSVFEQRLRNLRLSSLYDHEVMMSVNGGHMSVEPVALLLLLLLETYLSNWKAYKTERWRAYERVVSMLSKRSSCQPY